jgi:DNA-binding response OmpR family regulator
MRTVLVICKDKDGWRLIPALQGAGLRVIVEVESEGGLSRALHQAPQIVIMDEEMPSADGRELLLELRHITGSIIIVVGRGEGPTIAWALLQGADAYLVRPVDTRELLVRIHAMLRRSHRNGEPYLSAPLDAEQLNKILAQLSRIEAHLFRHLLEQREHPVAQEELLAAVWGAQGKDTSVRFYISRLRRKLARMAHVASVEILNLRGRGYLLMVYPSGASE